METLQEIAKRKTKINVIQLTSSDLKEFAEQVAQNVLENYLPKQKEEKFLTVNQTMEFLNVSRTALWRWEQKGILKPVKFGRFVRYRLSDIKQMANER